MKIVKKRLFAIIELQVLCSKRLSLRTSTRNITDTAQDTEKKY